MKVICPKCGKIIDANSNKNVAFCSDCGTTFPLDQGKKLFDKKFGAIANRAFMALTRTGDYDLAIDLYNKCLEIKPNDLSSIIGIALATLYKQDFLNLNFDKVVEIVDSYEIVLNEENTFLFLSFIEDVLKETKKYLIEANSRLFKDGKCISKIYLANYTKSLQDILNLIKYFKDGISLCSEEEKETFYQDHNLDEELDKLEKEVKELASIEHQVMEPEESLSDNRIIVVNTKDINNYRYLMTFLGAMGILFVLFLLLGLALNNAMFYYFMIVPAVLAIIGYLVYYFLVIKKKKED